MEHLIQRSFSQFNTHEMSVFGKKIIDLMSVKMKNIVIIEGNEVVK